MGLLGALGAGLGMSLVGSLVKPKRGPDQVSTQQTQLSPWEDSYWKFISERAQNLAQTPYQQYTGDRVAGFSDTQRDGMDYATQNATRWEQPYDAAQDSALRGARPFSADGLSQHLNPMTDYIAGNAMSRGMRAFGGPDGILDQISDRFAMEGGANGQFSSRAMNAMGRAGVDFGERMAEQLGDIYGRAYDSASNQYGQWSDRALQGAGALSALAGQRQALDQGTARTMLGVGGMEQDLQQRELDVAYGDHREARDWDMQRLLQASQAGQGMRGSSTTTSTQPGAYQPHPLQTFMGGAALYAGLDSMYGGARGGGSLSSGYAAPSTSFNYSPIGTSSNGFGGYTKWGGAGNDWGGYFKRGGAVRRYRKGGAVKRLPVKRAARSGGLEALHGA